MSAIHACEEWKPQDESVQAMLAHVDREQCAIAMCPKHLNNIKIDGRALCKGHRIVPKYVDLNG